MMDGQVAVIRAALDAAEHTDVSILAYSAKYASAFFGPFREAVDSSLAGRPAHLPAGPRATPARASARRCSTSSEGADIVMVKPALAYLDVVRRVRDAVDVPVAAYNVSGEYAMVEAAAAQRLDRPRAGDPRDAHLDPPRRRRRRAHLLGRRGRPAAALSRRRRRTADRRERSSLDAPGLDTPVASSSLAARLLDLAPASEVDASSS